MLKQSMETKLLPTVVFIQTKLLKKDYMSSFVIALSDLNATFYHLSMTTSEDLLGHPPFDLQSTSSNPTEVI